MLLNEIIPLIKNDIRIKAIKDLEIVPFGTTTKKAIVYKFDLQTSNKIIEQHKLEIKVISKDYREADNILRVVKDILLTLGDNELNNNVLEVSVSGGGTLEDLGTNTYHVYAYFIIKNRYYGGN